METKAMATQIPDFLEIILPEGEGLSLDTLPDPKFCLGLTDNNLGCTNAIVNWVSGMKNELTGLSGLTILGFVVSRNYNPKKVAKFMSSVCHNHIGHRAEWVDCCRTAVMRNDHLLRFGANSFLTDEKDQCKKGGLQETPFDVCQLELQTAVRKYFA